MYIYHPCGRGSWTTFFLLYFEACQFYILSFLFLIYSCHTSNEDSLVLNKQSRLNKRITIRLIESEQVFTSHRRWFPPYPNP